MDLLQKISEELQRGNFREVPKLVQEALDVGVSPSKILNDGLVAGFPSPGDTSQKF